MDQNDVVSSNSIQSTTKSATDNEEYSNSHRPLPTSGKEQWIPRRRRRKDEEINASARSSNSSSGNAGSHHTKISPASPNQPAFSGNNRDATTSGSSGASSGHTINNRPMAQQQQFDLAESSFPPLPVLDQNIPTSTAAPTNQNVTNNVSKLTEGTTSDVAIPLDATSNKLVTAIVPSTAAWGESRLADVVKGTVSKTKSNKTDKDLHSDTRSNSASPTPASHQNQQHSVGSQKSNDNSHTVISVKTIQNLDISLAQRSGGAGGEQQTDGELNVLQGSTVALTPPFSPEQCVAQTATTNNPNNKIKPPVIIKCTTADKSTKTDESLLNGLTSNASSSPSSAENASTIQNQLLNSSFENISVGGGVATTTSVATMTSMETNYGSASSIAKTSIGLVVSTSTMTTSLPKAHTQQYKQNTSKPIQQQHKSSTNNPSQTQVFISQTHPISSSPASPGSVHQNENFTSLASPPLTNNAIVDQNAASSSARLSYAQVAQHNKELLSKTAEPQLVQTQQQQSDKPEKHVEKDHKRKDFSPPRVSSHGDVRLERAGKT